MRFWNSIHSESASLPFGLGRISEKMTWEVRGWKVNVLESEVEFDMKSEAVQKMVAESERVMMPEPEADKMLVPEFVQEICAKMSSDETVTWNGRAPVPKMRSEGSGEKVREGGVVSSKRVAELEKSERRFWSSWDWSLKMDPIWALGTKWEVADPEKVERRFEPEKRETWEAKFPEKPSSKEGEKVRRAPVEFWMAWMACKSETGAGGKVSIRSEPVPGVPKSGVPGSKPRETVEPVQAEVRVPNFRGESLCMEIFWGRESPAGGAEPFPAWSMVVPEELVRERWKVEL